MGEKKLLMKCMYTGLLFGRCLYDDTRASQLRQLRQRLHEIWANNLDVLKHLEQVLGPLGPRVGLVDDGDDLKVVLEIDNATTTTSLAGGGGTYGRQEDVSIPVSEAQGGADEKGRVEGRLISHGRLQPDYKCLEEKFASLQQIQTNIRKAAG